MNKLLTIIIIFSTLLYTQNAHAQRFAKPVSNLHDMVGTKCYVELNSNDLVTGKFVGYASNGGITKIQVLLEDETHASYKAEDVKILRILQDAKGKNIIFKPVSITGRILVKTKLLQLLNPGFDSQIQVYLLPDSNSDPGEGDLSYIVVKGEDEPVQVDKSNYSSIFRELFSDCGSVTQEFGDKIELTDIAKHVYTYDRECN